MSNRKAIAGCVAWLVRFFVFRVWLHAFVYHEIERRHGETSGPCRQALLSRIENRSIAINPFPTGDRNRSIATNSFLAGDRNRSIATNRFPAGDRNRSSVTDRFTVGEFPGNVDLACVH